MTLPVIDISPMFGTELAAQQAVAGALGTACRTVGFAYIVGHGVAPKMMSDTFAQSAEFFRSPDEVKEAVRFQDAKGNRGYIAMGRESLDPGQLPDLKETFNIGLELSADDPDILSGQPFRSTNNWPAIAGFRDTMLAYYEAMSTVGAAIHRAFAMDLALDPDFFAEKFRKPLTTLRLLHYPVMKPQPGTCQKGAGVHTDYGNITLLATDSVGGLMVQNRNGSWMDAPPMDGAFICNIGDCLMRWTNDVYVSTPHKVEAQGKERYSIAFFIDPDPDAIVACIPSCAPLGIRPKYEPVTGEDYLLSRLEPTYAHYFG